jgi:hypothetical protein
MSETENTHEVEVPDIGTFTFRRRTPRLSMQTVSAAIDFIGEPARTSWQSLAGTIFGTLKVLTVSAPKGWDLDTMDPLDPEDFEKVQRVSEALTAAEARFRKGA